MNFENNIVFKHTQIYNFLRLCNQSNLERKVLDCGSGGMLPPIHLFEMYGFTCTAIDSSDINISDANTFLEKRYSQTKVLNGDIRNLDFEDNSFSFVYTCEALLGMGAIEIKESVREMIRVLVPEGLLFVEFKTNLSFPNGNIGESDLDTYENIFEDVTVLYKERRYGSFLKDNSYTNVCYIDYICKK